MPTIEELMEQTQKVMARNIAECLYAPNAFATRLGPGRRPSLWERFRLGLGDIFLKIANKLGAYNDYD